MKNYLITILMRDIVIVDKQVWKAGSMQEIEQKVSDFLTERQFKGKLGRRDVLKKTEEMNGDKIKWIQMITQSGDKGEVVFFISVEEGIGSLEALKSV